MILYLRCSLLSRMPVFRKLLFIFIGKLHSMLRGRGREGLSCSSQRTFCANVLTFEWRRFTSWAYDQHTSSSPKMECVGRERGMMCGLLHSFAQCGMRLPSAEHSVAVLVVFYP